MKGKNKQVIWLPRSNSPSFDIDERLDIIQTSKWQAQRFSPNNFHYNHNCYDMNDSLLRFAIKEEKKKLRTTEGPFNSARDGTRIATKFEVKSRTLIHLIK